MHPHNQNHNKPFQNKPFQTKTVCTNFYIKLRKRCHTLVQKLRASKIHTRIFSKMKTTFLKLTKYYKKDDETFQQELLTMFQKGKTYHRGTPETV